ncbi:MAG: hypothetical protein AB7P37_01230 [Ramlibacter sp.]
MDTLQMPTRAPAFSRTFPVLTGFLDSAWQTAKSGWLAGLTGNHSRRLETLRTYVLASLADCPGAEADRLRRRVRLASSVRRILELRESLFNGIARAQCQNTATRFLVRFDSLAPRQPRALAHARRSQGNHHAA